MNEMSKRKQFVLKHHGVVAERERERQQREKFISLHHPHNNRKIAHTTYFSSSFLSLARSRSFSQKIDECNETACTEKLNQLLKTEITASAATSFAKERGCV
jgi:hypothetical protein